LQWPLAAVLSDVENFPVRCDHNDCIALVGRNPKIAVGIESGPIRSFEQRTLCEERRLLRPATAADGDFPNSAARRIRHIQRRALGIENQPVGGDRLLRFSIRKRSGVGRDLCYDLGFAALSPCTVYQAVSTA